MDKHLKTPSGVLIYPNKILRATSSEIGEIEKDTLNLAKDMLKVLTESNGIGLAAPQIGISKRAIFVMFQHEEITVPVFMVDPEITWYSKDRSDLEEGCLSLPNKRFVVNRPISVKIRYRSLSDHIFERQVEGICAKCVQHEIDHLDGIMISDRGPLVPANPDTPVH